MNRQKKKIFFVLGTRPEVIKIFPLYHIFSQDSAYEALIISSGQQKELSRQMISFFDIPLFADLDIMKPNHDLAYVSNELLKKLTTLIKKEQPDLIFVQGDTTTAFIGGLAGFYQKVPVAHIEAGLRSFNIESPWPEESNRCMLSAMSSFHFAPTPLAMENLKKENRSNIFLTGNTIVDAIEYMKLYIHQNTRRYLSKFDFIHPEREMVLITLHRRELHGTRLKEVLAALEEISAMHPDYQFAFPVHFNPNIRKPVFKALGEIGNIFLIEPVAYDELLYLISSSRFIITDSGGIQEEAPSFGKQVIVVRDTTERSESIDAGIAFLSGYERSSIMKYFKVLASQIEEPAFSDWSTNPYGNGDSSIQIKSIIDQWFDSR